MKRRNRVLLMWMLTGIWLCVQSPWAHALRMQAHSHTAEQAAQIAADQAAEAAPCHGAVDPPAPAKSAGCCADGHCDDQCAQLCWTLAALRSQLTVRGAILLTPTMVAGLQGLRQRELFRPPI